MVPSHSFYLTRSIENSVLRRFPYFAVVGDGGINRGRPRSSRVFQTLRPLCAGVETNVADSREAGLHADRVGPKQLGINPHFDAKH
jgi:hypothetical protein